MQTDLYCVMGNPVEHSKSPWIHARFAELTGQALHYDKRLIPLDGFEAAVRAFIAEGGRGCNITVPHKTAAMAHVARIGTLGEMVSGIAHEVNQPLTAIANYANAARRFLRAGIDDKEELAAILDKIATQAERAGQVIRGLRSLSRRRDAVRERLEVGSLIAEVARLVEFELRARGWRLQIEVADGLPAISGDAVQIQQVLLNLIRNAVEQGRQAVEAIRKRPGLGQAGRHDLIIVGAGMVGSALALALQHSGLQILLLDGGPLSVKPFAQDVAFEPRVSALSAASQRILERQD